MEAQVNWLAVVLATLSTMVVGSIWYAPQVFGKKWMKLIGKTEKELGNNKAAATQAILITLVVSFISAYVLAHLSYMAASFYNLPFCKLRLLRLLGSGLVLRQRG